MNLRRRARRQGDQKTRRSHLPICNLQSAIYRGPSMATSDLPQRVEAIRRFNRFYTRQIGVLNEGLLNSMFSLAEARVIYELAHHVQITAGVLGEELGLDTGYL